MALEYGFTDKEKQNYYQPSKVYSSFGRDFTNDYIALHVYNMSDVLLVTKIMSLDEVGFTEDGTFVDLNIGQHLRSLGFRQGDYKVTYKFLRRLAGRPRTIFVDEKGKIFTGDVERKLINGETRYFQKTSDEEKSNNEPIEVFIREQKYIIAESSPDKSELRISTDPQVRNDEYLSDFKEMNAMIEYQPINDDNGGLIKFDSKDQNVLEFDINPQDRGFTQNMVGGQIVIPSLYKITGNEDTTNEDTTSDILEKAPKSTEERYDGLTQQDLIELAAGGDEDADRELQERAADRDY
jgi:hypothetical protein|tara:strand:- start:327 stop:1211 length:885 start_codon:yes stop_codon:yes gene_type:complete